MAKSLVLSFAAASLCTLVTILGLHVSSAQVMQSDSFQIQSDSLNIGGGNSTSTNFSLRSTTGEIATGLSGSDSFELGAGFQQMQEVFISLTGVTDVTMSPSLPGVTGGVANGSTTLTVITDSPGGYVLTIGSENDPAMQKGAESIADYSPGVNPSLNFNITGAEAVFGFSPEGTDITSRYKDNGGTCNTGGSLDTSLACWDGLTTSGQTIASSNNPNHPAGATTTVRFRVGLGAGVNLDPGFYVATTTVTALPL